MKTFKLIVSSPDGNVFEGEIAQLILRGAGGDLAVMAGHIPFITPVKPGVCRGRRSSDCCKRGYNPSVRQF